MYHGSTTKLNLTTGQKNSLKSLMKYSTDKKHYRRLMAILQKSNGRTFADIAKETWCQYQVSSKMDIGISPDRNKRIGDKETRWYKIPYNR